MKILMSLYLLLLCVVVVFSRASPATGGIRLYQGQDSDRDRVALALLVADLRDITGDEELAFRDGTLQLGQSPRRSILAHQLLKDAVNGAKEISVQFFHGNEIEFGSTLVMTADRRRIELDFSDFPACQGDENIRRAFSVGFVFLHELGHATRDLSDEGGRIGDCETRINEMRRECGYPLRSSYKSQQSGDESRLGFQDGKTKKYLKWSASTVRKISS